MAYPKWKYYKNLTDGFFRSTLVADEATDKVLAAEGWQDDPKKVDPSVVPYPAEVTPEGVVVHLKDFPGAADANGNYAYGTVPTVSGKVTAFLGHAV